MNETAKIENAIPAILAELEKKHYSIGTIKNYRCCYNGLLKFTKERKIYYFTEKVELDYVEHKCGLIVTDFFGTYPKKISKIMCCMHVLKNYTEYEVTTFRKRATNQPFKCPLQFQKADDVFNKDCIEREYSYQGFQAIIKPVKNFLIILTLSCLKK